jgi:lipopolysaccharide/colanic/teichoic acid biosynthesis glycosyltransferase
MRRDSRSVQRRGRGRRGIIEASRRELPSRADAWAKWLLDRCIAGVSLALLAPLLLALAVAVKLDSPGPAFFRCRRIGFRGRPFEVLKFRKMRVDASGPPLTAPDDSRFTRIGAFLARRKLDELPQLWNVLKGEMSLVGPRPEDPEFVALQATAYSRILKVRPGMTGLAQLAFARESDILDPTDRVGHYVDRLLPAKSCIDRLYAERRSLWMDFRILVWTIAAVGLGRDVAVHRDTGRLTVRRARTAPTAAASLDPTANPSLDPAANA